MKKEDSKLAALLLVLVILYFLFSPPLEAKTNFSEEKNGMDDVPWTEACKEERSAFQTARIEIRVDGSS